MPVRKVSNRGRSVIGRFPSLKMGRMIAFESLLERDFIYLLDYDRRVTWFEEQPLTLDYLHDDQTRRYAPDFQLVEAGQPVLVECKPGRFVDADDNPRKFAVAREWCATRGWEFRVVTDQHIRAGFRLQNIKRLTFLCTLGRDERVAAQIGGLRGTELRRISPCLRNTTPCSFQISHGNKKPAATGSLSMLPSVQSLPVVRSETACF